MSNLEASFSILGQKGVMAYILKGTVLTLIIALIAVVLGIVIGSVLALCRNYCTSKKTKIFGMIATVYIEVFRNTPLLLWIFICLVFCPCPELFNRKLFGLTTVETKLLFKAAVALILFTSSVIAEIIRGGPVSYTHLTLPMCIRDSVATIELMARTKQLLSAASRYNGTGNVNVSDVFVLFGVAALIYFIINYTLSCVVRTMQKRRKRPVRVTAD